MSPRVASLPLLACLGLAACNPGPTPVASLPPPGVVALSPAVPVTPAAPAPALAGPLLRADGTCSGPAAGTADAIAPGIGECDLVRLKGKPATDVLVGESGKGQREVQVMYAEPGGRELYFFIDNRLDRILKP
ncbi:MAG: hypothetical protein ABWY78_21510 [Microvirga sp.]